MKKLLMVLCAFILTVPISFTKGESPGLEIKQAYYTNKSPFVLEGFAKAGSKIEIFGQGISFKVGSEGTFKVELKVDEGINLFAITATKDGTSTTKGFMVEMDSTPPEVTLLVNGKLINEKMIDIELLDASQFEIEGFTEPGCKILADDVDYSMGKVKFEAKFKVDVAPSKSNHKLEITDKFGNKTILEVKVVNAHIRTVVLQRGNPIATIDGKEYKLPNPPEVLKGSTMIPVRFIVEEADNGRIDYDNPTKTAVITTKDKTITLEIGNYTVFINGKPIVLKTTPPCVLNGTLVVPFRFIGEELGFIVTWYNETKTITLTKAIYE